MRIDQINIAYDAKEDRILLRVRTQDAALAVLMLTRRLTKGLLDALHQLAGRGAANVSPAAADPVVRQEVMAFQHQAQVQASDFQKPFNPEGRLLFGDQPVLVTEVKLGGQAEQNRWRVEFIGREGQTLNMGLDAQGLHAVIKLFHDLMPKTGWDIAPPSLETGSPPAGQITH